jgi:hypothetical protein
MVPDATVAQISVKIQQAKESEVCGVKVCFSFVTPDQQVPRSNDPLLASGILCGFY